MTRKAITIARAVPGACGSSTTASAYALITHAARNGPTVASRASARIRRGPCRRYATVRPIQTPAERTPSASPTAAGAPNDVPPTAHSTASPESPSAMPKKFGGIRMGTFRGPRIEAPRSPPIGFGTSSSRLL
jgi:hypothetical protein